MTSDDTFRTLPHNNEQWPIRWRDIAGTLHSCEGAEVHRGIRLIWTDCRRDVPANAAFLSGEAPTCPLCNRRAGDSDDQ